VYNWRILLGGVATASILTVGVAAPALAQSVARTDLPTSSLSGLTQGTGAASGLLCGLAGLPLVGPVVSQLSSVLGASCSSAGATGDVTSALTGGGSSGGVTSAASSVTSILPGLSGVTSAVPGLSTVTSLVPGLSGLGGRAIGGTDGVGAGPQFAEQRRADRTAGAGHDDHPLVPFPWPMLARPAWHHELGRPGPPRQAEPTGPTRPSRADRAYTPAGNRPVTWSMRAQGVDRGSGMMTCMTTPEGSPVGVAAPSIGPVLLTATQIHDRLTELATQIDADYQGRDLVLLGVLKGAMMIMADLARLLPPDRVEIDWITLSSYGDSTSSSGVIRMLKEPDLDLAGRHVLVVDDITDSGLTLSWLTANLGSRGPASVEVLSLLRKPELVKVEVPLRYLGFDIPPGFIVGYGMDYAQRYRNLPYIATLNLGNG